MIEVVDPDDPTRVVDYGETGRVRLTTLTKEFFMPRFLERDEAEREPPCDAVSVGRRPQRPAVLPVSARPSSKAFTERCELRCCTSRSSATACRTAASTSSRVPHSPHARAVRRDQPGQRRADPPRSARPSAQAAARAALAAIPVDALLDDVREGGRASSRTTRCRSATRRSRRDDYVAAAVGDDRHAARAGAPQHAARSPAC